MIYDIIIVGGGPSGLSSAIYGLRANKKVLVIEKENFGGQIINTKLVENYPGFKQISGLELSELMYEQAKNLGMDEVYSEVKKIEKQTNFLITTSDKTYEGKTLMIATGAKHRMLNILHEEELLGKGISYCATCDGAFFKDLNVAVVGGGNTAIDDCLYLADICQNVYLIHRRDQFRAENQKIALLKTKPNIKLFLNETISLLKGIDQLEGITIKNTLNNKETDLKVNGLFVAIGQIPNTDLIKDLVKLDSDKSALVNDDCSTSIPGLYVAGDVRSKKIRQLTTATSDGTIASMMAIHYLENIK